MAWVTLHTIAKIETGSNPDPRDETLRKIADALGVGVDDLIQR
jgi:transcriptional regulator with XRE-family HTH domain